MRFLIYWFLLVVNLVGFLTSLVAAILTLIILLGLKKPVRVDFLRMDIPVGDETMPDSLIALFVSYVVICFFGSFVLLKNIIDLTVALSGRRTCGALFRSYRKRMQKEYLRHRVEK